MKKKAKKLKKDLFIVDTGDTHDGKYMISLSHFTKFNFSAGDGLSDVTDPRGDVSQPLITNIPYDLLTIGIKKNNSSLQANTNLYMMIGNHELYGM